MRNRAVSCALVFAAGLLPADSAAEPGRSASAALPAPAAASCLRPPLAVCRRAGYAFGSPWQAGCRTEPGCDPAGGGRRFRHVGLDLDAEPGDEVLAAAPGIVRAVAWLGDATGGAVLLEHDFEGPRGTGGDPDLQGRATTLYLHVEPSGRLREGLRVGAGERIARVFCLGAACEDSHLHFGVRRAAFDPEDALAFRGALPPEGAAGCPSCPSRTPLPEFPERWVDPAPLLLEGE